MKITETQLRKGIRQMINEGLGWDDEIQDAWGDDARRSATRMQPRIQKNADANIGKLIELDTVIDLGKNWDSPYTQLPIVFRVTDVESAEHSLPHPGSRAEPGEHVTYLAVADLGLSRPLEESDYVQSVGSSKAKSRRLAFLTSKLEGLERRIRRTPHNWQSLHFYEG